MRAAARRGRSVAFLTNNSSLRVGDFVAKLARFGIAAEPDDGAHERAGRRRRCSPPTSRAGRAVLACAGPGVVEALERGRLRRRSVEPPADAVVVGWHRDFDFDGLDRASRAVRDGARFVATNVDATYPVPGGVLPGAGAIVAAVATASGRTPEVAGKPEPPTVAMVRRRLGAHGRDGG